MIINHFYRSADAVIPISFVMRTLPRTLFVALSLQKIKILRQIFYVRKNHSNQKTPGKKKRGHNMLPKRNEMKRFFLSEYNQSTTQTFKKCKNVCQTIRYWLTIFCQISVWFTLGLNGRAPACSTRITQLVHWANQVLKQNRIH